uniref:calcium-activated chloride channel regulator 4-like isoform X1 n=1 Tax=Ciona intestinalis TaxID=7719 RepID=UPI000180BCC9|nr:calcium-activated chloride channel regulator 4-like isoform X1 [Ciona intestinalis]|eukprot:XP_002127942.1 calcium-activated chloride channel regulator 4-like isoform X1 [Ciona intestinalis]
MYLCKLFLLLSVAVSVYGVFSEVNLVNNGYEGIVVAINPSIPEDASLVDNIKTLLNEASPILWSATKNRAYFGEVTILVPSTWTGSYTQATHGQVYNKADIIVADPNPQYMDTPYTIQYQQCGDPGEYIHLTPNFLSQAGYEQNYGNKGKALVHEWAHLRWGVYDEYASEGYAPFYYSNRGGGQPYMEATRCPLALGGVTRYPNPANGNQLEHCTSDPNNNFLPLEGCLFFPFSELGQPDDLSASLLSHQFVDQVVDFCHNDTNDPTNLHNKEAPNEHNRLCDQRSVWEIMMASRDFNAVNHPNPTLENILPTINVRQQPTNRYVLVLDTSGSMSGSNYEYMMQAATDFIMTYIPKGAEAGIVEFSYTATTLSQLVSIENKADREYLASRLPGQPDGSTCIGCGILNGIEVLSNQGRDPAGGQLIVLTDGEENYSPYVNDVRDNAIEAHVVVDSIFFGASGNGALQQLTEDTKGTMYYNDVTDITGLKETFKQLAESSDGNLYTNTYQVYGNTYSLNRHDDAHGRFSIDSTIGKNTVFSFSWSSIDVPPSFQLTSPDGEIYCSEPGSTCYDTSVITTDTNLMTTTFKFLTATAGKWRYSIETSSHSQTVSVMVTSMASSEDTEPIIAESGISSTDISAGGQALVVYAKVMQGYEPIIGATVDARITSTEGRVKTLRLEDTGSAPDVRALDGIYSKYFTKFTDAGRYSVQITVTGEGDGRTVLSRKRKRSAAAYNPGYAQPDGTVVPNPNGLTDPNLHKSEGTNVNEIEAFSRVVSPGGFSYNPPPGSNFDHFPPSKVIDLKATQLDALQPNKGIVLTFTAPGDDYDSGRASKYEIRYLYESASDLVTSFQSGYEVKTIDVIEGDLTNPGAADSIEGFVINIQNIPNEDMVIVGFAMRATDTSGNTADVSNVAMMNLFLAPPPQSCLDKYGKPISGEPFEKPGDCLHFYQCSNGKLVVLECQSGTVFNPNLSVCDFPEHVPECSNVVFPSSTVSQTPQPGQTTTATENVAPLQPSSASCKDSKGQSLTEIAFADPDDCSLFYHCSNGILYTMSCPSGLVFNPTMGYCDWPYNVPGC